MSTTQSTPLDRRPEFQARMAAYWNPDKNNSFFQINDRITACARRADQERIAAINEISQTIQSTRTQAILRQVLDSQWQLLERNVRELREIEASLSDAHTINSEAYYPSIKDKTTLFPGHYSAFEKRLGTLADEISKIYKDIFFPFVQVLQNAEKGWDPSGIVCKVYDYYSWWQVSNAEKEIEKLFPRK